MYIWGCARSIPKMSATDRYFLSCHKMLNKPNLAIVMHSFWVILPSSYKKFDRNDGNYENYGNYGNYGNNGIDGNDEKDRKDDSDDADR